MMHTDCLFLQDAYLGECTARITHVFEDGIVLDRTVFYPQGGGQAGDSGWLTFPDGTRLQIVDTRKATEPVLGTHVVLHVPAEGQIAADRAVKPGDPVRAQIDWERRYRHMRLHTAAHVLCAVLPYAVDGCSITADYARLDFVTGEPVSR